MNKEHLQLITDLRHTLHRHPELSLAESDTARRLQDFLRAHTTFRIVERDGWFYAVKPGRDTAATPIAFRADMDALPIPEGIDLPYSSVSNGVSHKCGHDGHCAALCGLALALEENAPERTVYLIFQGAEEIGRGAMRCAPLLQEHGIGEIYAFHNLGGYPEGAVIYRRGLTQPASEGLTISLHGRQSHASAPESGINPAQAIARIALLSQELTDAPHRGMVLCTVTGIRVGTGDFGISAGDGEIRLTLRAENEREMKDLERRLLALAAQLAQDSGLALEHHISDYFPETRNHDGCLERVVRAAAALGVPCREMDRLWRASEDFGYYTKVCPGAIFYLGNGENSPPLHTEGYDFNDSLLSVAADLFTALALGDETA